MKKPDTSMFSLPFLMAELTAASVETIYHRTNLMMSGECTTDEYGRMVTEKLAAMQLATVALMSGQEPSAVLRPFHKRARANARRLRKSV